MKGKNYLAVLKGSKEPQMITLSKAGTYYKYGTNDIVHRDAIQYVYVIDKMETDCIPFSIFENYYVK